MPQAVTHGRTSTTHGQQRLGASLPDRFVVSAQTAGYLLFIANIIRSPTLASKSQSLGVARRNAAQKAQKWPFSGFLGIFGAEVSAQTLHAMSRSLFHQIWAGPTLGNKDPSQRSIFASSALHQDSKIFDKICPKSAQKQKLQFWPTLEPKIILAVPPSFPSLPFPQDGHPTPESRALVLSLDPISCP